MALQSWIKKFVVPMEEATANDTTALAAYLRLLDGVAGIHPMFGLDSERLRAQLGVWFRFGRTPRIVDESLSTFVLDASTNPLCVRHPNCAVTRACPLIIHHPKHFTCFEPVEDEEHVVKKWKKPKPEDLYMEDIGFPSPRLCLQKGDPSPMLILVRRTLKDWRKERVGQ